MNRADTPPRRWLVPALLLAAGLLVSAGAARWQASENQRAAEQALRSEGERVAGLVADRLQIFQYGLRGARGAVLTAGIETMTRAAFSAYSASRDIDQEFSGARGFGFIRRVAAGRQRAFAAAAERDGWPGFAVRQFAPHDGDAYVIQYIEPVAPNAEAVGLDIASETTRRAAADAAMRSGNVAMTRPITLVQAAGKAQQGFLILLPVYRPGLPLGTEAERLAACAGWAYAPLLIDEVLRGVEFASAALSLTLEDTGEPPQRFYTLGEGAPSALPPLAIERTVFGRRWNIGLQAKPAFVEALRQPRPEVLFTSGAMVSVLAAALLAAFRHGQGSRRQVLQAQQRLAALVESSSDAIINETPDGRIVGWNAAAERLLGYSTAEALGQNGMALLRPDHEPIAQDVRERLSLGEPVEPFDQVLLHKDGGRLEVSVAVSPIFGPDGQFVGVGRTLRDVSARSAAERQREAFTAALELQVASRTVELSTARRDLQAVLDAVPSMIGYWDRSLRNRFANHAYQTWLGAAPGAMTGRHLRDLLGEAFFEQNRPHIEAALRGQAQTFERALPTPGGGSQHSLVHYVPDLVDGAVAGFHVLVHDVTELKQSQQRLADSEDLLQSMGEVAGIGGWQVDLGTGQVTWSRQTRRIAGVGDEHRPSLEDGPRFYPEWPQVAAMMQRAADTGERIDFETPFRDAHGRSLWVRVVGQAQRDAGGRPLRLTGAFQDVTQRRAADDALREATVAAESANAAKSAFLANMSHEIRTPLNAVIGLTYLLEHGHLEPEQRGFVAKIQFASRALLGVVNDVLDLAKIEAGALSVEAAPFDLHQLLDELAALYGGQAQAKGLAFRLGQPDGLPRRVLGDAARLRQVLSNLLANALKFTERGGVALALKIVAREAGALTLCFEVHDTGIGIAPEVQESIFQPFAQADSSTTRRFGGTGLGLSIVRELSALLGGEVALRSTPGQGSVFHVTLRFGEVADGDAGAGSSHVALRLLVVDDDPARAATLAAQAQALGWAAEVAASVDAAVAALCRVSGPDAPPAALPDALPDALLVAAQLPDGGSLQALAAALGGVRLPPALLLGAADDGTPRVLAGHLQVDGRLTLPVNASSLFNAVNDAVAQRSGDPAKLLRATRLDGAGVQWLPGVRVLVVDDSEMNREVAARILGRAGALVTLSGSGDDALQRLREASQPFDLVMMDVQMPGMDGNEVTRRLRAEPGLAGLPVVALTAGALLAERQRALDAGMNDFLSKPLNPDSLIRCLRRHVERVRGLPLPAAQRDTVPTAAAPASWPEIEGIDVADAAVRLGHDPVLFRSLLQRLLREFEDLATEPPSLPQQQAGRDALAARAHKLRGSAGMLGARALQQLASELEAQMRRPLAAGDVALAPGAPAPAASAMAATSGMAALATMSTIAHLLRRLQQASAAVLAHPLPEVAGAAPEPLTPEARDDLLQRLRAQDLSALDRFGSLAPGLRALLGESRFEAVREAMDNLRFAQALALLEEAA